MAVDEEIFKFKCAIRGERRLLPMLASFVVVVVVVVQTKVCPVQLGDLAPNTENPKSAVGLAWCAVSPGTCPDRIHHQTLTIILASGQCSANSPSGVRRWRLTRCQDLNSWTVLGSTSACWHWIIVLEPKYKPEPGLAFAGEHHPSYIMHHASYIMRLSALALHPPR